MAHRNFGPCDCCGGETADCDDLEQCCPSTWPATMPVSIPDCTGADPGCSGFIARSVNVPIVAESSGFGACSASYANEGGEGYGIIFSFNHDCAEGVTFVCLSYTTGSGTLYWCEEFSDPDGSIYCSKTAEIRANGDIDCNAICGSGSPSICNAGTVVTIG